ncbi:MAG: branched-chain amino acid ABC transporter permease [Gaiellaceae bacterium]
MDERDLPAPPDARDRPRIGVDEWVAEVEGRREGRTGLDAAVRDAWGRLPLAVRILLPAAAAAALPFLTSSDFVMQVAVITGLYVLLALGLNVAVGFSGLLDLGYVAFYGFGAYGYTMLASGHFGLHWHAEAAIPVVVVATAVLGLVLGLPSRRLFGDYLAIVTLFFLQIFVTLLINADRINVPFRDAPVNFTRGPNGISTVDPLNLFGFKLTTLDHYFWFTLVVFVLVIGGLYLLSESRTGRAWKALREDPLAAELMGMPVNRLKLMAFSLGAAVAGLTGTIFAAQQGAVFPVDFDLVLLITLYAMVILGGAGSLAGVVIGAVTINLALEVLRTPEHASWIFYGALALVLLVTLRWLRAGLVLAGVLAFGLALRGIAELAWPDGTAGQTEGLTRIDRLVDSWVLLPSDPVEIGKLAFIALVASVLGLTLLRGRPRMLAYVPVLYLAAFVWQNVLVLQPSVARFIMLGAMLVALMAARPQGLLGTTRVEIV